LNNCLKNALRIGKYSLSIQSVILIALDIGGRKNDYDAVNCSNASQTYYREELRDFDERTFIPLAPPVFVDGPAL